MASEPKVTDISDYPDLLRLVEEIQTDDAPRVLRSGGQDVALLAPLPVKSRTRRRAASQDDVEAFMAAAGGWRDLFDDEEIEELTRSIYAARGSNRPSYEL